MTIHPGDFALKAQSYYTNPDLDETKDEVKASGGVINWIFGTNESASKRFLKVFDAVADDVTIGTTEADLNFLLPTQGDTNGAGFAIAFPRPATFQNGITVAVTGARALDDDTAIDADDVCINIAYK